MIRRSERSAHGDATSSSRPPCHHPRHRRALRRGGVHRFPGTLHSGPGQHPHPRADRSRRRRAELHAQHPGQGLEFRAAPAPSESWSRTSPTRSTSTSSAAPSSSSRPPATPSCWWTPKSPTRWRPARWSNCARALTASIVAASRLSDEALLAAAAKMPMVTINRDVAGVPAVVIDTPSATSQALDHLISLGHTPDRLHRRAARRPSPAPGAGTPWPPPLRNAAWTCAGWARSRPRHSPALPPRTPPCTAESPPASSSTT